MSHRKGKSNKPDIPLFFCIFFVRVRLSVIRSVIGKCGGFGGKLDIWKMNWELWHKKFSKFFFRFWFFLLSVIWLKLIKSCEIRFWKQKIVKKINFFSNFGTHFFGWKNIFRKFAKLIFSQTNFFSLLSVIRKLTINLWNSLKNKKSKIIFFSNFSRF